MLLEGRSLGVADSYMDPRVLDVTLLDPTINSRFPPATPLNKIVSQLFIEDWTYATNFISFYEQCAPHECTYSFVERFNKAYVIASTLGVVGGLSVTLRIIVPLIVKLLRRIYRRCWEPEDNYERGENLVDQ